MVIVGCAPRGSCNVYGVDTFCFAEEFEIEPPKKSFAISQINQHGTPFVLIVDRQGHVLRGDRRQGWRELVSDLGTMVGTRLPDRLARVIVRQSIVPAREGLATVVVDADVVAVIAPFEGEDGWFSCTLWRFRRDRTLEEAKRRYALTKREAELLDRILCGASSAEIARELLITLATVEWHTKRLLLKTDSQNRTQMVARVLGWLPDMT